MKVLREIDGYKLNQGNLMADGLFNVSDENDNVSFWFDSETAQEMMEMSEAEFLNDSIAMINYAMEMYDEI